MATFRVALLLALAALLAGCGARSRVENAVLICLDTLRFDTLALAHEVAGSDAASRYWRAGTRLVRAQSTAPWTLPAIASVFTGHYPSTHRAGAFLREVADLSKGFPLPLQPGLPTLADRLAEQGYETVGFVAHPWFRSRFGLDRGFGSLDLTAQDSAALIGRAEAWLDARDSGEARPFFLYLHFMDAHAPMNLGIHALRPALTRLSPALRERAIAANPTVCREQESLGCARYLAYVGAVAQLREHVARVIALLESRDLLDRSVVVLFSDHGEEFLEHEAEGRALDLDPRGRYGTGHGHALYQEQLHVPVVLWHPALAPGDVETPVSLVDLAPTLLGWLGVEPRGESAGQDLGEQLANGAAPDAERPLYASSLAFGPEGEAVLRGTRKRIDRAGSGAGALFFDLAQDPLEKAPVAASAAPDLAELLAAYRGQRLPGGEPAVPTQDELRELQALGYLEEARVE